jgi:very-short-patch-repair endonuclease
LNDAERTAILERYGLQVMRFSNRDVDDKFEGVCSKIDKTIMERIQKPPQSPAAPAPP